MEELFNEISQKIYVYMGLESSEDPYDKNISIVHLPRIPIDAIVSELGFAKAQWSIPGIITQDSKEIIVEKKHEDLIKLSQKIEINGTMYEGWRINGSLQYKREEDYLKLYVYKKQV